ncbi:hypothetical protein [Runella zeae]|uniref:hypothetical protein n=1 Tax=Runella zeae TaxID=94255 RepID=UPI002354C73F|nr:hypothetical protein [Runella zeae]
MAFKRYAVQDWQKDLDKKLYRYSSITASKNKLVIPRTHNLKNNWDSQLLANVSGIHTLRFEFPMYGRFLDMGVGKGISYEERRTWRSMRLGSRQVIHDRTGVRQRVRWYSKRKGFNQRRLSEVLVKRYGMGMVSFVENQLTFEVGITL